jgi:plastocyanin
MRTLLLSVAAGLALLGLIVPASVADDQHSGRSMLPRPKQAKLDVSPSNQPPSDPFRSSFYFPKDPPARPAEDEVRDVELYDNYFSPSFLMVASGKTVRFINRGRHHHTTTADWLWESGELKRGASFSITFSRPGRYYYHCRNHRDMYGTIVVF